VCVKLLFIYFWLNLQYFIVKTNAIGQNLQSSVWDYNTKPLWQRYTNITCEIVFLEAFLWTTRWHLSGSDNSFGKQLPQRLSNET